MQTEADGLPLLQSSPEADALPQTSGRIIRLRAVSSNGSQRGRASAAHPARRIELRRDRLPTSRRVFLKSSAIAGASAALGILPGAAASTALTDLHEAQSHASQASPSAGAGEVATGINREPGIYPGAPGEIFSPTMVADPA